MEPETISDDLKNYKVVLPNYTTTIKANKVQMLSDTGQTVFFHNKDTVGIAPKDALIEQVPEFEEIESKINEK